MIMAKWRRGKEIGAEVRGHELVIDQPLDKGGRDQGPTATELFGVSLAACSVHYTLPFLERRNIPPDGLAVSARLVRAENPPRVGRVELTLTLPHAARGRLSSEEKEALRRAAHTCYVQRTLAHQPEIDLSIVEEP